MKEISLSQLKRMSAEELKAQGSFRLTINCQPVALVVVPKYDWEQKDIERIIQDAEAL